MQLTYWENKAACRAGGGSLIRGLRGGQTGQVMFEQGCKRSEGARHRGIGVSGGGHSRCKGPGLDRTCLVQEWPGVLCRLERNE